MSDLPRERGLPIPKGLPIPNKNSNTKPTTLPKLRQEPQVAYPNKATQTSLPSAQTSLPSFDSPQTSLPSFDSPKISLPSFTEPEIIEEEEEEETFTWETFTDESSQQGVKDQLVFGNDDLGELTNDDLLRMLQDVDDNESAKNTEIEDEINIDDLIQEMGQEDLEESETLLKTTPKEEELTFDEGEEMFSFDQEEDQDSELREISIDDLMGMLGEDDSPSEDTYLSLLEDDSNEDSEEEFSFESAVANFEKENSEELIINNLEDEGDDRTLDSQPDTSSAASDWITLVEDEDEEAPKEDSSANKTSISKDEIDDFLLNTSDDYELENLDEEQEEEEELDEDEKLFSSLSKPGRKKKKKGKGKGGGNKDKRNPLSSIYLGFGDILYKAISRVFKALSKIPVIGKLFTALNTKLKPGSKKYLPLLLLLLLVFVPFYFSVPKGVVINYPDGGEIKTSDFNYKEDTATGSLENTGEIILIGEPVAKIYGWAPTFNPKTWFTYTYLDSCEGELLEIDIDNKEEISIKCKVKKGSFKKAAIEFEGYF